MSIFLKAKKLLGKSDACVISDRGGDPKYVMVRWEKWKNIKEELENLKKLNNKNVNNNNDDVEDLEYTVDINDLPV